MFWNDLRKGDNACVGTFNNFACDLHAAGVLLQVMCFKLFSLGGLNLIRYFFVYLIATYLHFPRDSSHEIINHKSINLFIRIFDNDNI